jgi:hypothetical protein
MKRNKMLRFCGYLPCLTALLFLLFSGFESNAQQLAGFCGEIHKPNNPVPTDSIYYMDRFGNYYTESELQVPPLTNSVQFNQPNVITALLILLLWMHLMLKLML